MDNCTILFVSEHANYTRSLGDALRQHGHVVHTVMSWDEKKLLSLIALLKPDILLTVGCCDAGVEAMPQRVSELCRYYNLLHVYWATEDKIHFERVSLPVVRRLQPDLVLTLHPDCISLYRRYGYTAAYFNFALHPRLFPPKTSLAQEVYDLSFVGTTHLEVRTYRYQSLQQLLFPLIRSGQRTEVWGRNWQEARDQIQREFGIAVPEDWDHGYLPFDRTANVYHQSRIMLGVQNAEDQVTQRTFEILGTGAFMIASRTQELMRLFREGEEIVLTSSPEETLELIDYYLRRPEERLRIGTNAREAVLKKHTFSHRLAETWPIISELLQIKKERYA